MSFVVAPIVEGHGDVAAVPLLLRRMAPELAVARPVRCPRTRVVRNDYLIRMARIANANIQDRGAVLVLFDADQDCAAQLGPELESELAKSFPDRLCRVVLAVRGFEAWIAGGDASYGLDDADSAGNLKSRIRQANNGLYQKTVDQPKLIAKADLTRLGQVSRSFGKLFKVVGEFVRASQS